MVDTSDVKAHQLESGPTVCGPYIAVITNKTANLVIRGVMLFSVGVFLSLVLNLLQVQRNITLFPPDVIASVFSSAWWVPPCCGTVSGRCTFVNISLILSTFLGILFVVCYI